MSCKLLITGARAPVSLDLASACRMAGYSVQLADSSPAYAARMAKICPLLRMPSPRYQFADFTHWLHDYCQKHSDTLIIPTCEEVFYIRAAAEKHGFTSQVLTADLATLRQLHSKVEFPALLSSIGIRVPKTETLEAPVDQIDCSNAVLKPEFSRFGSTTLIRPTVNQTSRIAPSPTYRWVMQEFIAGEEFCLWSAARNGTITASVVYRPKWRHGQTAAYAFEAISAPKAIDIASQLVKDLNYTGQIGLDMICTPDGDFVPIECNPRAVSGIHLFDRSPELARALSGNGPAVHITSGLRYLAPAMWLMGLPKSIIRGQFRQWQTDMTAGGDALGQGRGSGAILGALLDAARFAAVGASRLRLPAGQTTDDIEWNGEVIA